MQTQRLLVGLLIGLTLSVVTGSIRPVGAFEPFDFAARLTAIGPRVAGTEGQELAATALRSAMLEMGLEKVGRLPVAGTESWHSLEGRLPGREGPEIVLSAHYDTVDQSPGALDNASGSAVVLGAAADLGRTPRSRPVRVLLFDGEEALAAGSRAWLETVPEEVSRTMLANIDLDMVGSRGARQGVLHILATKGVESGGITPAWLIHAVLQGAAAAEFPIAVMDRNWSWLAQLSVRCTQATWISDGDRFLEREIPALRLSDIAMTGAGPDYHSATDRLDTLDPDRLRQWTVAAATIVRRLDRLADRPVAETEYLVIGGRVFIRRDLIWVGFTLWVVMVWRGLPGRWRGAAAGERRRAGREYLPGFAFRMLFLLAVFLIPTFASLLLYPVAILALVGPSRGETARRVLCLLGALPTLMFALWLTVGQVAGWFTLTRAALLPAILVSLVLATFCTWIVDDQSAGRKDLGQ